MGRTLVGNENIYFEYIIEVEGYQRPLLLLQFSLNASMTMRYKNSGKASTWDHVTDTRRCTIWHEKEFESEAKITTIFSGDAPDLRLRGGGVTFPIVEAGLVVAADNIAEEFGAWFTNIFEKGACRTSKGKRRRKSALRKYRKAFRKSVDASVDSIINSLGDEAASAIRDEIRNSNTGEKLIIKKVVPRAIPLKGEASKKLIAKQIHKSIIGKSPSENQMSNLMTQPDVKSMTKVSADICVSEFTEKLSYINTLFEPLNLHANNVEGLIKQGGERRAPKIEYKPGDDRTLHEASQTISDYLNSVTCVINKSGGHMSPHFFPANIELSKQIEEEFSTYNKLRTKITEWLDEGRNITRLLNVLHQSSEELEELLDEVEDKTERSNEAVSTYVRFLKQMHKCSSYPRHPSSQPVVLPELRRSDILALINSQRDLTLPIKLPDIINLQDNKLFDDFEDYLPDDLVQEELRDISISKFLGSVPSLKQLDEIKRDIVVSEISLVRDNQMFDADIRSSAYKIEEDMRKAIDAGQLDELDQEIRSLANKISTSL